MTVDHETKVQAQLAVALARQDGILKEPDFRWKELEGILGDDGAARWTAIRKEFAKRKLLGGAGDDDPVARVVAQLHQFNDGLDGIREGIAGAGREHARPQTLAAETIQQLNEIIAGLRAVPVNVDINVVPVQESHDGPIEKIQKSSEIPPLDIRPEVRQGDDET